MEADDDLKDVPCKEDGTEDETVRSMVDRRYKEALEFECHNFVLRLRSKDRTSGDEYLCGAAQRRSLDYLFDLWATAEEQLNNWTLSTEVLGRLIRFLMKEDAVSPQKTPTTKHGPNEAIKKRKNSENLASKLKLTVKPLIKVILGQTDSQMKASKALQEDMTRRVIKIYQQADHEYCFVVPRIEASSRPPLPATAQLLWVGRCRSTAKSLTEELAFLRKSLGTSGLVSVMRTLCLLDPELLVKKTGCNSDLVCGALASYLNKIATPQEEKVTSVVLGKLYPFRLISVPPTCDT